MLSAEASPTIHTVRSILEPKGYDESIVIVQDGSRHQGNLGVSDGTGGWLWHASKCLAKHLLSAQNNNLIRNKSILELGSGTGWLALNLAKSNVSAVVASESSSIMPLLCRNVYGYMERVHTDLPIDVQSLDWQEKDRILGKFDLVVASDVLYLVELYPFLLKTILAHGNRCIVTWEERKPEEEVLFLEMARSSGFCFEPPLEVDVNPGTSNKIWLVDMFVNKV